MQAKNRKLTILEQTEKLTQINSKYIKYILRDYENYHGTQYIKETKSATMNIFRFFLFSF